MSAPLIGITTSRQKHQLGFPVIAISEAYVQAVSQAGGIPVSIPLGISGSQIQDLLSRLDGILLSGGGDIDPDRFGADPHPKVNFIDKDRDRVEIQLIQDAIQQEIPFLGICRGIQTLNVALGGTLYTHISDQHPDAIHHAQIEGHPKDYLSHEIQIKPETKISSCMGQSNLKVNSMHHQGIHQLASGLVATAYAPDGLIEAVELEAYGFGLAVQWHPEWLTAHTPIQALFQSFIQAAAS